MSEMKLDTDRVTRGIVNIKRREGSGRVTLRLNNIWGTQVG